MGSVPAGEKRGDVHPAETTSGRGRRRSTMLPARPPGGSRLYVIDGADRVRRGGR